MGNFREFLAPGAHNPVNVDGTITELVRNRMEVNPTRYVFDEAQVFMGIMNYDFNKEV